MEHIVVLVLISWSAEAGMFCAQTKIPIEVGEWDSNLTHIDSAAVEIHPVSINEGQVYVYDNNFPGYIIKYIHVDNVAIRSCGASATIKKGGVGSSTVLIVLHADTNEEIRSVIDIWGTKNYEKQAKSSDGKLLDMQSRYLFKELRAVNHNNAFF